MDGRLFIQFLALALMSGARRVAKGYEGLKHMTVREMMEAMESVVRITYPGKHGCMVTEAAPCNRKSFRPLALN